MTRVDGRRAKKALFQTHLCTLRTSNSSNNKERNEKRNEKKRRGERKEKRNEKKIRGEGRMAHARGVELMRASLSFLGNELQMSFFVHFTCVAPKKESGKLSVTSSDLFFFL